MTAIKEALSTAYGVFLATADHNLGNRPAKTAKTAKTPSLNLLKMRRVQYDASKTTLTHTPEDHKVSATATRRQLISSTHKVATALDAGAVIAAAEDQAAIKALWLRYCYDPYLDIHPYAKTRIERQLLPLIFGVWCYWPRHKTPSIKQLPKAIRFFAMVVNDAVRCERTGSLSQKTPSSWKAEQLGYGSGREAYQKSDYSRQWRPIEQDILALCRYLDDQAMHPVCRLFGKRARANEQEQQRKGSKWI